MGRWAMYTMPGVGKRGSWPALGKVNSSKAKTIPKLELMAAKKGVQVAQQVLEAWQVVMGSSRLLRRFIECIDLDQSTGPRRRSIHGSFMQPRYERLLTQRPGAMCPRRRTRQTWCQGERFLEELRGVRVVELGAPLPPRRP